jgi:tetratricopeptide (TPR) repeat protein
MAKTSELTEVGRIQREIAEAEKALDQKREQMCKQEQAIGDFCEALALLKNPPRYTPAPGELAPFDALQELLHEAQTEPDRQQRITAAEAGLEFARQAYSRIESELKQLRDRLTHLRSEHEWHQIYEPHAHKYRSAYPFPPTPEESRENRLTDLEASIIGHQRRIAQAEEFIELARNKQRDPSVNLPAWSGIANPEDMIESSKVAIAQLKASLEFEKARPLPPVNPRVEVNFRSFVRSRVAVEQPLQRFLKAQQEYIAALDELKQAFIQNPDATDFGNDQTPKQPQILIKLDPSNKIIRETLQQPVPSRRWW